MECRSNCGMCCIIPSFQGPIPGHPYGKPAGVKCVHLDATTLKCAIWGTDQYPKFCRDFKASPDVCGDSQAEAKEYLLHLEAITQPDFDI